SSGQGLGRRRSGHYLLARLQKAYACSLVAVTSSITLIIEGAQRRAYLPITRWARCHSLRASAKSLAMPAGGVCWDTSHFSAVIRRSHLMVARVVPPRSEMKI